MLRLFCVFVLFVFVVIGTSLFFYCRCRRGDNNELADKSGFVAAIPSVRFTLMSCAAFAGFRWLYLLTPEYRYWIEEDWRGRWIECPGRGLWGGLAVPVFLALLVSGVVAAKKTVKRLSAAGGFCSRRYLAAVLVTETSMVVPLALYSVLFGNHPFWWKSMLSAAAAWCVCRALSMIVTVLSAERAWRDAHPEQKRYGRASAVTGILAAYVMLTVGGYKLVRFQLGEYADCPCELEGLVEAGVALIAGSLVTAAAALALACVVKGVRCAAWLLRRSASDE